MLLACRRVSPPSRERPFQSQPASLGQNLICPSERRRERGQGEANRSGGAVEASQLGPSNLVSALSLARACEGELGCAGYFVRWLAH